MGVPSPIRAAHNSKTGLGTPVYFRYYLRMENDPIEIPESFRSFDRDSEVIISRNNLPHWRQEGATYFITFRLADALPQSALREFEIERQNFRSKIEREKLEGESLRKAIETFAKQYGQRFDEYLDRGIGSCILKDPANSKIVADSLRHYDGDRYQLYSAVVMPNHCHLLVRPFDG